jgi:MOSC domain-containing protein
MSVIGQVESLWRYPVKSMCGHAVAEVFVGFSGVYGDRLFAFKSDAAPVGFPYFTGREWHEMLLYRPRFRYPEKAARPANLAEAEEMSPLLNPVAADPADLAVEVETPSGEVLAIDDPALLRQLDERAGGGHSLTLLRSERAMTRLRSRTGPALPDDYPRSGHGSTEPGDSAQGYSSSRRHRWHLWRGACGRNRPGWRSRRSPGLSSDV